MSRAYREVKTVAQALDAPSHRIVELNNVLGIEKVEALIKLQLVYLNEILDLKRPLGELQIDEIAAEVVATYYYLTMADVHVIMRRAKTGHYGEFYESLTMPKVMNWFANYFEERCETCENRSLDAHSQVKEWNDTSRKSSQEKEREAFAMAKAHHLIEKAKTSERPVRNKKKQNEERKDEKG